MSYRLEPPACPPGGEVRAPAQVTCVGSRASFLVTGAADGTLAVADTGALDSAVRPTHAPAWKHANMRTATFFSCAFSLSRLLMHNHTHTHARTQTHIRTHTRSHARTHTKTSTRARARAVHRHMSAPPSCVGWAVGAAPASRSCADVHMLLWQRRDHTLRFPRSAAEPSPRMHAYWRTHARTHARTVTSCTVQGSRSVWLQASFH